MRAKGRVISNFGANLKSKAYEFRPNKEEEITECISSSNVRGIAARGYGMSYNDCSLNSDGYILNTERINHLLSFKKQSKELICQSAVTFGDILTIDKQYIPPVVPGTLYASIGGGIANDIHGKNNPSQGTLGKHINWLELIINKNRVLCSPKQNMELFYATIAGLGLTGVISRCSINLIDNLPYLKVAHEKFQDLSKLLSKIESDIDNYTYQAAWLDLINYPNAILYKANHCSKKLEAKSLKSYSIPPLPFKLITAGLIKLFNKWYFKFHKSDIFQSFINFNNPLDKIHNWHRLYGKNGLIQFQSVFSHLQAQKAIEKYLEIINKHQATACLAVLKRFTQTGPGLLSFCQPGYSIAIDFINNHSATKAIKEMNQYTLDIEGKLYLAKDIFLTAEQFPQMYPNHDEFRSILKEYQSPMRSDIARRLGIIK